MITMLPTHVASNPQDHLGIDSSNSSAIDTEKAISSSAVPEFPIEESRNLVTWDGPEDTEFPQNWSTARKLPTVLSLCGIAFSTSFSSSVFAPAVPPVAIEFGVSETVATLGVSLYVLGFAAGKVQTFESVVMLLTNS